MQDVEHELPKLINNLLQAPAHRQRQLIETYFTPNCRLTHALVSIWGPVPFKEISAALKYQMLGSEICFPPTSLLKFHLSFI